MISVVPTLTNSGMSLLIRSVSGEEQITFTRFKLGSGELPAGQDADELRDLITPCHAFAINEIAEYEEEGYIKLTGTFESSEIEDDFTWRELGVFARGEDGDEVLYGYANSADDASTLRSLTPDIGTEQTIILIVAIGRATNITAIVAPREQYASATELASHVESVSNPHNVTKAQIGLGNVLNYAPKDAPIAFTEAQNLAALASQETTGTLWSKTAKAVSTLISHLANKGNPHEVTKSQVGLGNVTNTSPSNGVINFVEAESAALPETGQTNATIIGKITKCLRSLFGHVETITGNPHHVTKSDVGLDNVVNLAPSFMPIAFETAQSNSVPTSGDTMSQIMSKVARTLTSFISHIDTANNPNPHGVVLSQIASFGTYTGNGALARSIALDFTPSVVLLYNEHGQTYDASKGVCGGLATSARGIRIPSSTTEDDATVWDNDYTALLLTDGGFKVTYKTGNDAEDSIDTNENGVTYVYIAFR